MTKCHDFHYSAGIVIMAARFHHHVAGTPLKVAAHRHAVSLRAFGYDAGRHAMMHHAYCAASSIDCGDALLAIAGGDGIMPYRPMKDIINLKCAGYAQP